MAHLLFAQASRGRGSGADIGRARRRARARIETLPAWSRMVTAPRSRSTETRRSVGVHPSPYRPFPFRQEFRCLQTQYQCLLSPGHAPSRIVRVATGWQTAPLRVRKAPCSCPRPCRSACRPCSVAYCFAPIADGSAFSAATPCEDGQWAIVPTIDGEAIAWEPKPEPLPYVDQRDMNIAPRPGAATAAARGRLDRDGHPDRQRGCRSVLRRPRGCRRWRASPSLRPRSRGRRAGPGRGAKGILEAAPVSHRPGAIWWLGPDRKRRP